MRSEKLQRSFILLKKIEEKNPQNKEFVEQMKKIQKLIKLNYNET
jgi:hypothetical protein